MQDFLQPAHRPVQPAGHRAQCRLEDGHETVDPVIDGGRDAVTAGEWRYHQGRKMLGHDDGGDTDKRQKAEDDAPCCFE